MRRYNGNGECPWAGKKARRIESGRLSCRETIFRGQSGRVAGLLRCLQPSPTAIFASTDEMAVGIIRCTPMRSGIGHPARHLLSPGIRRQHHRQDPSAQRLTSVRQPLEEMGEVAVQAAGRTAFSPPLARPNEHKQVPFAIVERDVGHRIRAA
jgi:DNA-binding LacI/PurR family transcriptional regulator